MFGLRVKIFVGFGGLLAILLMISLLGNWVLTCYSAANQRVLNEDVSGVGAAEKFESAVDQIDYALQCFLRGKMLESAPVAETIRLQARSFEENLAIQEQSSTLSGEREATQRIASCWRQFKNEYEKLLLISDETAKINRYNENVLPLAEQVRAVARTIFRINRDDVQSSHGESHKLATKAQWAMRSLTVVGGVIAVLFVALISRVIMHPLYVVTESVRKIEQGNLDLSMPVTSSDEFGILAVAFNNMAAQLRAFRRADRERVSRSRQTTQVAIDSLPDAVFVVGADGKIEQCNHIAKDIFNFRPGMDIASPGEDWLKNLHRDIFAHGQAARAGGYDSAVRRTVGNEDRFFLPKALPIFNEENHPVGSTIVLSDITDLRRLDEMKNGLLSLVAHELKTPLTSMRMILHLLAEEKLGRFTDRQRELLIAARDDSDRLHQIIENLMDMGRIESGKVFMELQSIEATELVRRTVQPLRTLFEEHGVGIEIASQITDVFVMADVVRIGHVFTNLLQNALRYTAKGGHVRIGIAAIDNQVCFSVGDTGVGIPRQYVNRIFEKFFRVPGQCGDSGAGLGLAIVKDIVEAHGGQISVESTEGVGTTFRITLKQAKRKNEELNHVNEFESIGAAH